MNQVTGDKLQRLICYLTGHKWVVLSRINAWEYGGHPGSQFGHAKCSRCGHEETYQYDA